MKRYGYHRTSTREQNLDRGVTEVDRLGRNKQETLKEGIQAKKIRPFELINKLGMSKATYYRYVDIIKQSKL